MALPRDGSLDKLVSEVAAANPNTIVINSTGSPTTMPWLSQVAGVVQTWFPGQEAGHSIADVIFGTVNPSGKLPVTFPKSEEYAPSFGNFPGDVGKLRVEYQEDIFIGYRHYDLPGKQDGVLFPFGFGLSYTQFEVLNVRGQVNDSDGAIIMAPGKKLAISATIRNTGNKLGSESVQVYVALVSNTSSIPRPKKVLVGFAKAQNVAPGAKQTVQIEIEDISFEIWDEEKYQWNVDQGKYVATLSTSSSDKDVKGSIPFEVVEGWSFNP
jgi:beta-glucosidase